MKKVVKITIFLLGLIILTLMAGWIYKTHMVKRYLPDYNQKTSLPGLKSKVEVYRDSFAIPHIFAENENDLYFTTGYLTAQDRLWQMDLLRRVTTGRLSEIFGEKLLKTDILMRMLRIPEKSRKVLAASDSSVLKALEAYAAGVNLYIEQHKKKLPIEFSILGYVPEKWKPEHSINLIGYIAWDLNGSWNSEILIHQAANILNQEQLNEFIPKADSQKVVIFSQNHNNTDWRSEMALASHKIEELGLQVFHGSNNWVVSGKRTLSGKPILANDMHLGFGTPGIWYQIHQNIKNKLNVTGVLLPGQPFIVSGHNASIAWGLTNVMNDDIDFYRETTNPSDSNVYKYDGSWKQMTIKKELIAIKGKDTVPIYLRFTHRGPVISGIKNIIGETISMHWVGNEMSNEVSSMYYLNRATNYIEFTGAMKTFSSVSQNVAYADTAGNIGLYCCAGIPIRKNVNPADVLPGDTSASDWTGFVPFEELPHVYNPQKNFAISANNRTIDKAYPYYISNWFDLPFRYNRINELIARDSLLTVQKIAMIQTDQISDLARGYLPKLLDILSDSSKYSTLENNIIASLKKWNYSYNAEDYCPAVFELFYNQFIENLIKDELGNQLFSLFMTDKILVRNAFHNAWNNNGSVFCDNVLTPQKEQFSDIVTQSFHEVIIKLSAQFGNNYVNWKWGELHTLTLEHPLGKVKILNIIFGLNKGPFRVGGSFHTIAPYSYKFTQPYMAGSGASQRHIYNLNDWDQSLTIIPTGNSGNPSSKHYCDQTKFYLEGKYHADIFTRQLAETKQRYYAVFTP